MKSFAQRSGAPVRLTDDQFYLSILAFMSGFVAVVTLWMALILHSNFLTIACDTAEFQNTIVNTLHGHWFRDTVIDGPNLLGMHALFIFLLLVPVYTVLPSPEVLFVVQICAVYSTVIALYFVAKDFGLKPLVAFVVAASALVNPIMVHMALAPFHPETWIAAAVLATYHFYRANKPLLFAIFFAIGLTSGEMAAFIYLSLGLGLFLGEDGLAWRNRYGSWLVGVSLAWLVLSLVIISPAVRVPEQQNLFAYHYQQWNVSSAPGLLFATLHQPMMTLGTLFDPRRWAALFLRIGPLLFFILASRTALAVMLVSLPIYFLMDDQEYFLYFHAYYFAFAFLAAYLGFLFFLSRRDLDRVRIGLIAGVYCVTIVLLCGAFLFYFQLWGGLDVPFSSTLRAEFARIPLDAAVYAPHRYSAYLSNRPDMVMGDLRDPSVDFDTMVESKFATTNVHASQIDYIVSDFWTDQCGWRHGYADAAQFKARSDSIAKLVASGKWTVFWQGGDVAILQRVK